MKDLSLAKMLAALFKVHGHGRKARPFYLAVHPQCRSEPIEHSYAAVVYQKAVSQVGDLIRGTKQLIADECFDFFVGSVGDFAPAFERMKTAGLADVYRLDTLSARQTILDKHSRRLAESE